jgi:hypothetical protein
MKSMSKQHFSLPLVLGLTAAGFLLHHSAGAQTLGNLQFNEGKGATVQDQAAGLLGQLGIIPDPAGALYSTNYAPSGKVGDLAVAFNRAEYLMVEDVTGALFNAMYPGAFTMEAWYSSVSAEMPAILGSAGSHGGNGWSLGFFSPGSLTFTQGGVADNGSSEFYPGDGSWTHVACVYEPLGTGGANITCYLGSAPDTMQTEHLTVAGNMNQPLGKLLRIGAWLNGGYGPYGQIDRFRLHAGALAISDLDSDPASPKAPLVSTLLAYNFDEGAAPYANAVANGPAAVNSDAYLYAPRWVAESPSGLTNDFALSFLPGNSVQIADPAGKYQAQNSDLTLQAWVKVGAVADTDVVLSYGSPSVYQLSIGTDQQVRFTAVGTVVSTLKVPADPSWHHVAVVHTQGNQVKFYLDGSLRDTQPYTSGIALAQDNTTLYLGRSVNGSLTYSGALDRVKIDKTALSANQLDWWPVPGVAPVAPTIAIERAVRLTWPDMPSGYTILQQASSLVEPVSWTTVNATPTMIDLHYEVFLPAATAAAYYRLVKP